MKTPRETPGSWSSYPMGLGKSLFLSEEQCPLLSVREINKMILKVVYAVMIFPLLPPACSYLFFPPSTRRSTQLHTLLDDDRASGTDGLLFVFHDMLSPPDPEHEITCSTPVSGAIAGKPSVQ